MTKGFDEVVGELPPDRRREVRRVYLHVPDKASQQVDRDKLVGTLEPDRRKKWVDRAIDVLCESRAVELKDRGYRRTGLVDEKEKHLYSSMKREIENTWATQEPHNYQPAPQRFVRVFTDSGGEGRWGRPDLTLIGGKTLPFLPGKFLDVITFEVKFWNHALVGLYEALAHRRSATHSYLVFYPPQGGAVTWEGGKPKLWDPGKDEIDKRRLEEIKEEALRHGLGIICAFQEDDSATWRELVQPVRHPPDPERLHRFISSLVYSPDLPERRYEQREALREWLEAPAFGDLSDVQLHDLGVRNELRVCINQFLREVPSARQMEDGLTCPEVDTLARRLNLRQVDATEIFEALRKAGYVTERPGSGKKGIVKTSHHPERKAIEQAGT